ncbi:tyrosine phosphatase-like protein [Dichotomocladium elegans]|nr:tyrosine phosphatase-like protein [Dichotomocladium elegans]
MSNCHRGKLTPVAIEKKTSETVESYLLAYNALSFSCWFGILITIAITLLSSNGNYESVHHFVWSTLLIVQSAAILEVLHSLFGLVRAPVTTTAMQVASRLFLVWGVNYVFPQIRTHWSFTTMTIAWSIAECVRYSFYACNLLGSIPSALNWARYNFFLVLYPTGVGSELTMVYKALPYAKAWNPLYYYFLIAVALVYIPGFPVLFSHMLTQRRKYIRTIKEEKKKSE